MANYKIEETIKYVVNQYLVNIDGEAEVRDVYQLIIGEVESVLIRQALEYHDYNQSKTARWLGITRNTLKKKMQEFGLCERS